MTKKTYLPLVALALLVVGLNAPKPFAIDDSVYRLYALHIAAHPLDPYGFDLFGHESAMHTLAPPTLLYWWAGAICSLGDSLESCKLTLFPFGLLLTFALYALFRRFCPGLEGPLTAATMLSPALLPSWNFMLDLPALALSLAAVALFLHALDRRSLGWGLLAGFLAGLAMQTKYTAFVVPAVFLWYAWGQRQLGRGVVAAAVAFALFWAWEAWLLSVYGQSHFLYAVGQRSGSLIHKARLLLPLISTLGGVAPWLGLLALAGLGAKRWVLAAATTIVAVGFAVIAWAPDSFQVLTRAPGGPPRLLIATAIFAAFGTVGIILAGLAIRQLLLVKGREDRQPTGRVSASRFLIGWLALEILGYFLLTPFPAVRRVLGVQVAATLLIGRLLATRTSAAAPHNGTGWGLATAFLLGGLFYYVDLHEAIVERRSAERVVAEIRRRDPQAIIRFIGEHGFLCHAERAGMCLLTPGAAPDPADWLVVRQSTSTDVPNYPGRTWEDYCSEDRLPLRTIVCFYAGGTPLEHHEGPRHRARIFAPAVALPLP